MVYGNLKEIPSSEQPYSDEQISQMIVPLFSQLEKKVADVIKVVDTNTQAVRINGKLTTYANAVGTGNAKSGTAMDRLRMVQTTLQELQKDTSSFFKYNNPKSEYRIMTRALKTLANTANKYAEVAPEIKKMVMEAGDLNYAIRDLKYKSEGHDNRNRALPKEEQALIRKNKKDRQDRERIEHATYSRGTPSAPDYQGRRMQNLYNVMNTHSEYSSFDLVNWLKKTDMWGAYHNQKQMANDLINKTYGVAGTPGLGAYTQTLGNSFPKFLSSYYQNQLPAGPKNKNKKYVSYPYQGLPSSSPVAGAVAHINAQKYRLTSGSTGTTKSSSGKSIFSDWKIMTAAVVGVTKAFQALSKISTEMVKGAGDVVDAFSSSFGEIVSDPIGSMAKMISGTGSGISSLLRGGGEGFGLMSDIFSGLAGGTMKMSSDRSGSSGKGGKSGGKGGALMAVVSGIFATLGIISGLFSSVMSAVSGMAGVLTKTVSTALTGIFKFVKQIMNYSPVMKAILDLIQLAIMLIFMPFFNVFAEKLLPIISTAIDYVLGLWETISGWADTIFTQEYIDSLKGIFENIANILFGTDGTSSGLFTILNSIFTEFVPAVLTFFTQMISAFIKYIPEIIDFTVKALEFFGSILENDEFIKMVFDTLNLVLDFFLNNKDTILSILTDMLSMMPLLMNVLKALLPAISWITGGVSGTVSNIQNNVNNIVGRVEDWWNSLGINYATGGIVNATPGGVLARIGEAGQSEAVIPLDQMSTIGGTTYVIQFTGDVYGMDDFNNKVEKVVQKVTNKSYYR